MENILDLDASEIANKIKSGEVSSLQVTETYIRHLLVINQRLHALTQERFAEARDEARRADEMLRTGDSLGRLHGVPITIKDSFHVAGMRTTGGLIHRKDVVEKEDSDVVKLLKSEGAIILGKTNTPALCFCQETDNKLHGRTNNPWDLQRTAGGSSGGEGALIAAGGAAVGIGADIGGSIRFPAHCNGVIGFKSGFGQVSDRGNYPDVTIPEQQRMLGIGAIAKSVADARLIHQIIARREAQESLEAREHGEGVDLASFSIALPSLQRGLPLGAETEEALRSLHQALSAEFDIDERLPPHFADAARIWQEIMSIDGAKHIRQQMSEEGRLHPWKEYLRERTRGDSVVHRYLSWALIGAAMFQPSSRRMSEIQRYIADAERDVTDYFAQKIAILPVYHRAAPLHGQLYKEIFSIRKTYLKVMPYVAYANVWGLPALTVPICEDRNGMPIGVQLITRNGNEEALFQLGEKLEQQFRGYVRCRKYDDGH